LEKSQLIFLFVFKAKPEQNSTSSLSKLSMIVAGINTKQEESSNGDSPKV